MQTAHQLFFTLYFSHLLEPEFALDIQDFMTRPSVKVQSIDLNLKANNKTGKAQFANINPDHLEAIFWANVDSKLIGMLKEVYQVDFDMFGFEAEGYLKLQMKKFQELQV